MNPLRKGMQAFKWKISKLINNFRPFRFVYISVHADECAKSHSSSMLSIAPYQQHIFLHLIIYIILNFDTITLAN